ncbi:hypothetical protein BDZ89DRAFT_922417, partial [Hymenopellis radicata]
SVPPSRLLVFSLPPHLQGPKRRNTFLDGTGDSPSEVLKSPWNGALIHKMKETAEEIVEERLQSRDQRFGDGKIEWSALFKERLRKV